MDFNKKQIFSIRKLTIGACSVLLGMAIVGINVSAEETTPATPVTTEVSKAEAVDTTPLAKAIQTLEASIEEASKDAKLVSDVEAAKVAVTTAKETLAKTDLTKESVAAATEAVQKAEATLKAAAEKTAQTEEKKDVNDASRNVAYEVKEAEAPATSAIPRDERNGKTYAEAGIQEGSSLRSADAAISTDGENVTLPANDTVTPNIDDANGATITTRQPADPATYALNPAADKYTFSMVSLDGGAQASGSANTNRYVRFSKAYDDSSTVTVELVDKVTGNVVETQTLALGQTITLRQTNNSNYFLKLTSTETTSTSGRKYNVINGSFRDANDKSLSTLQMHVRYDVLANAKVGEKIDQFSTQIPKTAEQVTFYKEVNPDNPTYNPSNLASYVGDHTDKETVISKFTQKAMEGQIYTPSQKREFTDANGKKVYMYASSDLRNEIVVGLTYNVGDKYVQFSNADSQKEKISTMIRTVEFVKADGTAKVAVYLIKPESARQVKGVAQGVLPDDNYVKIAEVEVAPDKYNDLVIPLTDSGLRGDNGQALYYSTEAFNGGAAGILTWGNGAQNLPTQITVAKNDGTGSITIGGTRSRLVNDNTAASVAFYYYAPVGNVTVHYEDTNGNVIKDPIVITEDNELAGKPVKTDYTTVPNRDTSITKDGKVYKIGRASCRERV